MLSRASSRSRASLKTSTRRTRLPRYRPTGTRWLPPWMPATRPSARRSSASGPRRRCGLRFRTRPPPCRNGWTTRHAGLQARKPEVDEVIALSGQLEAELVFTNEHTNVTVETLTTEYEQLDAMLGKAISEAANQIEQRDALGVSEDEIADLKKTYNHFDKDKSGTLDRLEFRACLMAS